MMTLIKKRAESTKMLIEHMIDDLTKDFFEELYFIMEMTKLLAKNVKYIYIYVNRVYYHSTLFYLSIC